MAEESCHAVANLCYQHALYPNVGNCSIMPNEQFDVGRKDFQYAWGTNEQTISTHHLRFRCIMFDSSPDEPHVNPLIYFRVLSSNTVNLKPKHPDVNHRIHTIIVNKASSDILLNQGDVLELTPNISLLFTAHVHEDEIDEPLDRVSQAEVATFFDQYLVTNRILGAGGNASVYLAYQQHTQRQVACKVVPLQTTSSKRDRLAREYNVLKNLDHPNIIRLEKVFCASHTIYIFQELITGGDLLSYMGHKGTLAEPQAAAIVRQVLKAVEYLHNHQIAHRDIKPENILMTSWADGTRIVLTDFGQARAVEGPHAIMSHTAIHRMQTFVGTPGYTAPEVYHQRGRGSKSGLGYSKAVDIWSVGCIAAILLVNDLIFADQGLHYASGTAADPSTQDDRQHWNLDVMDKEGAWQQIGRKAKSFIQGCLTLNEHRRLTAADALHHDWFTNRHYAVELEDAYLRAVADWKPRDHGSDLIEVLDTTSNVSKCLASDGAVQNLRESTSHHFTTPRDPELPPFQSSTIQGQATQHLTTQGQLYPGSSWFTTSNVQTQMPETLPDLASFAWQATIYPTQDTLRPSTQGKWVL